MKTPLHDASARQHSGEPSSGLGPVGAGKDRLRGPDLAELDCEIAGLVDRSTKELRRAWRTLYHTGPPLGLSRDLIIRGLADKLQQRARGGPSRELHRRLRLLAGEFEKGPRSFDPGKVLKTGATLVRQWRGPGRRDLRGRTPRLRIDDGGCFHLDREIGIGERVTPGGRRAGWAGGPWFPYGSIARALGMW